VGWWVLAILAVVQGLTEFLPISSSGHLVIGASLLGPPSESFDVAEITIALHVGTLLSILVYYRRRIVRLAGRDRGAVRSVVVGTIPAVLVGVPVEMWWEDFLESPLIAGLMLLVTGCILLGMRRPAAGDGDYPQMSVGDAWWVGLAQAAAILPGLSRSGSTIFAGTRRGLRPQAAATFSFLLAIPAIAGAGLLKAASMVAKGTPPMTPWSHLLGGVAISFVVGLAALAWLVAWLEQGRIWWFALWCLPLGVLVTGGALAGWL